MAKAEEYLTDLPKDESIHSIEGLADYINISRSNIYLWASQEGKEAFSDILEKIREKQSKTLINKGLKGEYNSAITKLMLTKHGYADKIENDITSKGEQLATGDISALAAKAAELLKEQITNDSNTGTT